MKKVRASGSVLLCFLLLFSACKTTKSAEDDSDSDLSGKGAPRLNESEKRRPGKCQSWSEKVTTPMFDSYALILGNADHRLWHYLWHGVRNSWHELSAEDRKVFTDIDPTWAVPADRTLGTDILASTATPVDSRLNNSGEDFLYMHHNMISVLRDVMAEAKQPCIVSWPTIPDPRETASPLEKRLAKVFPVPNPKANATKRDEGVEIMKTWEHWFNDPVNLKAMTLGELGSDLEFTIHNNMHMRWTKLKDSVGERPAIVGNEEYIKADWPWNKPEYDLLADTYSSHINRNFWKLHGLIDNYIYRWLAANNYKEIAENCGKRPKCYQWKGTWEGGKPPHHAPYVQASGLSLRGELRARTVSPALDRFRRAANLVILINRASRMDQGAIDDVVIDAMQDPEKRKTIAVPSFYVKEYVKHTTPKE